MRAMRVMRAMRAMGVMREMGVEVGAYFNALLINYNSHSDCLLEKVQQPQRLYDLSNWALRRLAPSLGLAVSREYIEDTE
jgi:hypothetical protein